MIPVLGLLMEVDNKLNSNSNLTNQFIPNETKIDALNNAQNKLLLKKIGLNNNYQLGLDAFKKRYEDLQVLIVPYEKLSVTAVGDQFNSYSSSVLNLVNKFFVPIDLYVLATKDNCKNRILNIINIVRHGDLQMKLNSPHFTPNFRYQESLATISGNNIYTYSDKYNTFTINSLYITYLRYPVSIDIVGYTHLDGTPSTTVNCELDPYLFNELVDLTVEELSMNTHNQETLNNTIRRIQEDE